MAYTTPTHPYGIVGMTEENYQELTGKLTAAEERVRELEELLQETENWRTDGPFFVRTFTVWWVKVRAALKRKD